MAVQTVEKEEVKGTKGRQRGINEGAVGMVMDIVQTQQYQKPTESTVRELTANAVDSQSEKERAYEIIRDGVSPDKYFVKREGALYANSNWDPSYYSMEHLNEEVNDVELTYKRGDGGGRCDTFAIKDCGVGIGKDRLEGVLEIGYSTKRNRKDALGAFGIGAKVGLATGADYYTITSVYNGVKHIVKVFDRKINSLIGALNLESGEQNVPYTFSDGEVIYGEKTDEKNYTIIEVPAMKHHRDDYIRAVETQLLYFTNVRFFLEEVDGTRTERDFRANILYNSENLIISTNSPYSKPHIVIVKGGDDMETQTGVCYGYVDFQEMELQDMSGDIGIKCPIRQVMTDEDGNEIVINEGVEVVPSREAVRWTAHTRDFLKKQFGAAQDEASNLIEKELAQTDFLMWLDAAKNIAMFSGRNDSAIGRLSKIVDLSTLKPRFNKTKLTFENVTGLFQGFKVVSNTKYCDKDDSKYKAKREPANGWNSVTIEHLYFKTVNAKRHTDCYIADQGIGVFTTITPMSDAELDTEVDTRIKDGHLLPKNRENWLKAKRECRDLITMYLQQSSGYKSYDDVVVPDDYISNLSKMETKQEENNGQAVRLSAADRRKLEERVVCHTFVARPMFDTSDTETYKKQKKEPKYQEVLDYQGQLYYGFGGDHSKLQFACHLLDRHCQHSSDKQHDRFYNNDYQVLTVSQSNKKHFSSRSHINDFFGKKELVHDENGRITGCNIVMDNAVVHWNTARKVAPYMKELEFMINFGNFNEDVKKDYDELAAYVKRYHSDLSDYRDRFGMDKHFTDFVAFLDNIEKLQTMGEGDFSDEDIALHVKESSLPSGITGGLAVNRSLVRLSEKLRAYAGPIKTLLNHIPALKEKNTDIPLDLSMIIGEFIDWKGELYEVEAPKAPELPEVLQEVKEEV